MNIFLVQKFQESGPDLHSGLYLDAELSRLASARSHRTCTALRADLTAAAVIHASPEYFARSHNHLQTL